MMLQGNLILLTMKPLERLYKTKYLLASWLVSTRLDPKKPRSTGLLLPVVLSEKCPTK